MSREIKFRAWDTEDHKMVCDGTCDRDTFLTITFGGKVQGSTGDDCGHIYGEDIKDGRFILMQFTGLHDKSGREIYEGDIVRVEDYSNGRVSYDDGWGAFVWIGKSRFVESQQERDRGHILGNTWSERLREVIGNIHENPEVLGK